MPIPLVCPLMSMNMQISCLEEGCAWWDKPKKNKKKDKGCCIIKRIVDEYRTDSR